MAAVISLPIFAIYTLRFSHDDPAVRDFSSAGHLNCFGPSCFVDLRAYSFGGPGPLSVACSVGDVHRESERLQAQIVQSEKLVSLGQLAAGAAHEINNPARGNSRLFRLLADDPTIPEKARITASKIRDQARRTKTLVGNLLSFARQVPAERTLLDINNRGEQRLQLRALDLRSGTTRIELRSNPFFPAFAEMEIS